MIIRVVNHMHLLSRKYACKYARKRGQNMHQYASICLNMHESAFISKQYLQIIIQNLTIEYQE